MIERPSTTDIRSWILFHHERPDGPGYPEGRGESRGSLESSIIAVADAYEAMTSDRPYRPALTSEDAGGRAPPRGGTPVPLGRRRRASKGRLTHPVTALRDRASADNNGEDGAGSHSRSRSCPPPAPSCWRPSPCASAGASRRSRARIADADRTDPLTGLLNRRAFEELLELELERAARGDRPMSVVVGDIDCFRGVNEQHGHAAGDAALQAVAQNALKWKRRIDVAARIGGEEFALLLPGDGRARRLHRRRAPAPRHPPELRRDHGRREVQLRRGHRAGPRQRRRRPPARGGPGVAAAKDLGGDRTVIYSDEVARALDEGSQAGTELQLATVIALAEALDIRDTGTGQHSQTVGRYAS